MKMSGEERIAAPREVVWKALNDPAVLKKSITGCKELTKSGDNAFAAKVQAAVGPVKATFNGEVKLTNIKAPQSYTLSGEGKGGVAGFAKGKANVKLAEDGNETILTYDVDAKVGGKLAQIGSRLVNGAAKKMAGDFFKKFSKLAAGMAEDTPTEEEAGPAKKTTKKPAAKKPAKKPAAKKAAKKPASQKTAKQSPAKNAEAPKPQAPDTRSSEAKPAAEMAVAPSEDESNTPQPSDRRHMMIAMVVLAVAIIAFFYYLFGRS